MTKKYLGFVAGLLLLTGCSNNDFIDKGTTAPEGQMSTISTINATMDNADTRVQLKDGNQLIWNEDDVINVFSDDGPYRNYTLTSGAGTSSATFTGDEVAGNQFYALFCNTIFNLDRENEEVSMYWDSDAIFGKDGLNINYYMPLFAKSANANMQFKHLGSLLHFQVTGKGKLSYASLYGNNGEEFYDEYTLKYTSDEISLKPYDSAISTTRDHIGSKPNNDLGYIELSDKYITHFYFMLPAGMSFENGFTLVLGLTDGEGVESEVTKKYESSFTVNRGEVSTFPIVSVSDGGSGEIEPTWTFHGAGSLFDLSGAYVYLSKEIEYADETDRDVNYVTWRLRFTNFVWGSIPEHFQEVVVIWGHEFEGDTPSFPDNATITDYGLDIMSDGYSLDGRYVKVDDENVIPMYIYKTDDGAYEITIKGVKMYPIDSTLSPIISAGATTSYLLFTGEIEEEIPM